MGLLDDLLEPLGTPTLKPAFEIWIDGTSYTDRFTGRLISLSLRDLRGMEADTLSLEIDDHDGLVAIPEKGAVISLQIGFEGALRDKGLFTVDNAGHSGPPDRVRITAHSADFRGTLKVAKERSFHDKTLGQVLEQIATDHQLQPAVAEQFKGVKIPHVDQTNESDAHFLTRLAKRYDAIATIKTGKLIFIPKGRGKTASGQTLPTLILSRSEGDQHNYEEPDRESKYTGVKTFWDDKKTARRNTVLVGEDGEVRTLRDPYPTEDEAKSAAKGEWGRIQRGKAAMDITLARGRPDLMPEQPVRLVGWKQQIVDWEWCVAEVEHSIDGGGYKSGVKLEVLLEDE